MSETDSTMIFSVIDVNILKSTVRFRKGIADDIGRWAAMIDYVRLGTDIEIPEEEFDWSRFRTGILKDGTVVW